MSQVLIVARTRMHHGHVCVGGHDLEHGFSSIRLLDLFGDHWPVSSAFAVGDIWELDYRRKGSARSPHVEDSFVKTYSRVGRVDALREFLRDRVQPWRGSPDVLFDGTLKATNHGTGYVPLDGRKPKCSTGYWQPEDDLEAISWMANTRFQYSKPAGITNIKWVGVEASPAIIPAGALVRVSLTRAFDKPPIPAGYYLQISGMFSDGADTLRYE